MAYSNPSTRSTGYTVTATNWNEYANNFKHLLEVNYTAFNSDVTVTATTVGTANVIVAAGSITYENVPHWIEFFSPRWTAGAAATNLILLDGSTVLGTMSQFIASQNHPDPLVKTRITPTAGSHNYKIAAWNASAATGTMRAGSGGTAGDASAFEPGYLWITRAVV